MSTPPDRNGRTVIVTDRRALIPLVVTGLIVGTAFIAIYVGLQRDPTPHRIPLAVVGPQLATAAQTGLGNAVSITQVASLDDGAAMVRDSNAIAVVEAPSPTAIHVEYAGASGLSESGAARKLVGGLAARAGATVEETDIVPLVKYDSRGLSAFYVVFGVTLASFVLAQGLTAATKVVRLRHRLLAMGAFAGAIGLISATVAGPIYGSLTAPFVPLALSLILLSAASAFGTKALGAWLGPAGIGLAVLILTTIGNATSGATIGYDLLPGWARAVSAALPPGAAVRAVNGYGYFDGAHTAWPITVLLIWFAVGLSLVLLRQWVLVRNLPRRADEPDLAVAAAAP